MEVAENGAVTHVNPELLEQPTVQFDAEFHRMFATPEVPVTYQNIATTDPSETGIMRLLAIL